MSTQPLSAPASRRGSWSMRHRLGRGITAGTAGVVAAVATVSLAGPVAAEPAGITITVDADAAGGRTIPQHFLGLSWEADQLHQPWMAAGSGNLAALLNDLGPGTLRFSANAVDRTPWQADAPADAPGPVINAADLHRAGELARAVGWPVDLGVNLAANNPAAAADEVRTARRAMGPMLRSVQIGNEPDIFPAMQLKPYDPQIYLDQAHAYRDAIDAAAPDTRYGGPDAAMAAGVSPIGDAYSGYAQSWRAAYVDAFAGQGDYLNQHYYPLLRTPGANTAAMVDQLNSPSTAATDRRFIDGIVREAEAAGMEPHLSETNSVAGNGQPGVSNTFGAALWTLDYLLTAANSGIAGVNMHQQPQDCGSYAWVCLPDGSGDLHAQPPFYAGLLFSQLRGGTFLPAEVSDPGSGVSAHALRMPDGHIKVVVDDYGREPHRPVSVKIENSDAVEATTQSLTGPNAYATSEIRFADAEVAPDGSFTPGPDERITGLDGRFDLAFDGPAAVVLDVP